MMTRIIDTHVHAWKGSRSNPWLETVPDLNHPMLPDAIDNATECIFVEAGAKNGFVEARWVASLTWPTLRGIVAAAHPERGKRVTEELDHLHAIPGVAGVRRVMQDEAERFFSEPNLSLGLRQVSVGGLVFEACVRKFQLKALRSVLSNVPELKVVLDHLGKPPVGSKIGLREWFEDVAAISQLPNVFVKISGLAPESDPSLPLRGQTRDVVTHVLSAFGPERCMLGSDWPVSARSANWPGSAEWFDFVLSDFGLTSREASQVASKTARSLYGLT